MSRYTDLIGAFMAQRTVYGDGTVPLNTLITARLASELSPDQLRIFEGRFLFKDKVLSGTGDLYAAMSVPGAHLRQVLAVADANGDFVIDCTNPPAVVLGDFTAETLGDLIGATNRTFLALQAKLWDDNIRKTGIYAGYQIDRAVAASRIGVIVYPDSGKILGQLVTGLPPALQEPAFTSDKQAKDYAAIVQLVKPAILEYVNKDVALAAQAVADAMANVAFWSDVYDATAIIASPFTGAKDLFGFLGFKGVAAVLVLGAAGVLVVMLLPEIRAVSARVKAA